MKKELFYKHYLEIASFLYKLRRNHQFDKELAFYNSLPLNQIPFFRLEKNGVGPWYNLQKQSKSAEHWLDPDKARLSLSRYSSLVSDVWYFCKEVALHACLTEESLFSWFSEKELTLLFSEGYRVNKYFIKQNFSDVFFADNQVLLIPSNSPKSRSQIISEFKKQSDLNSFLLNLI